MVWFRVNESGNSQVKRINRRGFLQVMAGLALGGLLSACGNVASKVVPLAEGTVEATKEMTRKAVRLLSNENRNDRNVRYIRPFPAPDPGQWKLEVGGLVREPKTWTFTQMQELPPVSHVSRMKCVECWSWKAEWGGFTMQTLLDQVKPNPEARYVYFDCLDEYWEVLSIEDLLEPGVIFAYKMDGKLLLPEYGSPLRVIVPSKYAYKGAKAVQRITFKKEPGTGYWSSYGYTVDGHIEPGFDHPQDLPGGARQISGGEVIHEEDKSS
jgi:sulfoxide reductase catalytic subunit YedY